MKKFIYQICLKLTWMSSILLLGAFVFFWLPSRPFSSTLFLGDSHFNKEYQNPDNLALGSESTYFSYLKLKQILKQQRVDTIYLAFGYHSLSDYFIEYDQKSIIVERYFPYMPIDEQFNHAFQLNYPRMITSFGRQYLNRQNPLPGFFEAPPNISFNLKKCLGRTLYIFKDHSFYQKNLDGLDSIRTLCASNNIVLFLVNTPLHACFRKSIPARFVEKYKAITNQYQLINLEESIEGDQYFLPDGDHLNMSGVMKFTLLMNRIRANQGKYSEKMLLNTPHN